MIGLVLLLLLPTPTIWFSLDPKRDVSGIGTLFSLDHKFHASDYYSDSDSVASENQPLTNAFIINAAKEESMIRKVHEFVF